MNGYEATRQIMERVPTPIVLISASISRQEVAMTFEALKAGALTVLDKPHGVDHLDNAKDALQLQETVKLMAGVKVIRRWPVRDRRALSPARPNKAVRIHIVAIGASTGGPTVLAEILRGFPGGLKVPVLVVQHIAQGFAQGLAEWINRETSLEVKLAESGEIAQPGAVYLAPHGAHMGIGKDFRIHLTNGPEQNGFRPSVSHLLHSVADAFGRSAVGILLSGMGQDGASGLLQLRTAGGLTIAQDEYSSVVFGMPGEAVRLGAAQHVLSPKQISDFLHGLAT
jgi:two-component system chemotaxis response regulator CheB